MFSGISLLGRGVEQEEDPPYLSPSQWPLLFYQYWCVYSYDRYYTLLNTSYIKLFSLGRSVRQAGGLQLYSFIQNENQEEFLLDLDHSSVCELCPLLTLLFPLPSLLLSPWS